VNNSTTPVTFRSVLHPEPTDQTAQKTDQSRPRAIQPAPTPEEVDQQNLELQSRQYEQDQRAQQDQQKQQDQEWRQQTRLQEMQTRQQLQQQKEQREQERHQIQIRQQEQKLQQQQALVEAKMQQQHAREFAREAQQRSKIMSVQQAQQGSAPIFRQMRKQIAQQVSKTRKLVDQIRLKNSLLPLELTKTALHLSDLTRRRAFLMGTQARLRKRAADEIKNMSAFSPEALEKIRAGKVKMTPGADAPDWQPKPGYPTKPPTPEMQRVQAMPPEEFKRQQQNFQQAYRQDQESYWNWGRNDRLRNWARSTDPQQRALEDMMHHPQAHDPSVMNPGNENLTGLFSQQDRDYYQADPSKWGEYWQNVYPQLVDQRSQQLQGAHNPEGYGGFSRAVGNFTSTLVSPIATAGGLTAPGGYLDPTQRNSEAGQEALDWWDNPTWEGAGRTAMAGGLAAASGMTDMTGKFLSFIPEQFLASSARLGGHLNALGDGRLGQHRQPMLEQMERYDTEWGPELEKARQAGDRDKIRELNRQRSKYQQELNQYHGTETTASHAGWAVANALAALGVGKLSQFKGAFSPLAAPKTKAFLTGLGAAKQGYESGEQAHQLQLARERQLSSVENDSAWAQPEWAEAAADFQQSLQRLLGRTGQADQYAQQQAQPIHQPQITGQGLEYQGYGQG